MRRHKMNFTAFLIVVVITFVFILPVIGGLADDGFFKDIWLDVIEAIPFGSFVGEAVVKVFSKVIPAAGNFNDYLNGIQEIKGLTGYLQEFCKLCLTSILYGALNHYGEKAMGLKGKTDVWMFLQKVVWNMISAFICAVTAGLTLKIAFGQINQLVKGMAGMWTSIIGFIILAGGAGIFSYVLGISAGLAVGYIFVRLVLMNICSLMVSSGCLAFVILCFSERAYSHMFAGMGAWMGAVIILIGIDMMLSSVFKN